MPLSHAETVWRVFFFSFSTSVTWALRDNTGMLSRCLESTRLGRMRGLTFSSVWPWCLGFQHATVRLSPRRKPPLWFSAKWKATATTLLVSLCYIRKRDELLPNLQGVHLFFSSCQEVERSYDDSSLLKGPNFRTIASFRSMGEARRSLTGHYSQSVAISEH